ncbi:uncharacterized protein LOC132901325 isoform X2 [Neoarius graeffei]|uniref:uncharacterized protein LOC132901325 isoform X2 n=1 Tax=Neoarius graeffei TaxID=443677 RepID=UPI00298C7D44|nr:uncharacterized protein LOC132901325 isoform X2 [Neoarius graeffei]
MPAGTFIPHRSHYGFYAPGYHYCSPGSLDSNMNFNQHPAASNVYCGYYPYFFFGYHQYTGQNPNWQAGESVDLRESDVILESLLKLAELQRQLTNIGYQMVKIDSDDLPDWPPNPHEDYNPPFDDISTVDMKLALT